ncbi:MAG TPA: CapA family protein [Jatrophihabitans sp.]|nr:CapA family protein [Jatrophihabitans sp.]
MTRATIGLLAAGASLLLATGCQRASSTGRAPVSTTPSQRPATTASHPGSGAATRATPRSTTTSTSAPTTPSTTEPPGQFSMAFAGDVHFMERTATLLARDPATAFGTSAPVLSRADLTMVNLETAIAVGGRPEAKSFTFQAPPSAFTALRAAGVDLVTMANNHGADYGSAGLAQTEAAIRGSGFPVVGIGASAAQAYAPYYRTVNGVRIAVVAASQVQDETLAHFSAGPDSPGIANAYSDAFLAEVRAARAHAEVVIAYVHWGTEYQSCPNADQQQLAGTLAAAGVTAIIGTHAHVLQGAGWRPDGAYVAYGLGNYYWWRSFGNDQDDNGVLTLTFARNRVAAATFLPSRLDAQGISPPATGASAQRIDAEWEQRRQQCTNLLPAPPH